MPFSKFDPNRPIEEPGGASTPSAARRAKLLKWANWVTLLYTLLGFGFIAYWLFRS